MDGPISIHGLRYAVDGYLHGMRQPFLQAALRVVAPATVNWTGVDVAFRALVPGAEAAPRFSDEAAAGALQRVLYWTAALQRAAGDGAFEPGRQLWRTADLWVVALPTIDPNVADAALKAAVSLINRGLAGGSSSEVLSAVQPDLDRLDAESRRIPITAMTIAFLKAAHARGTPWLRLGTTDAFQIGHGARGRWLQSSSTDGLSRLAAQLSNNKAAATSVLRQLGFPAPAHLAVLDEDMAVTAAETLGYPVVVKPIDKSGGAGVRVGLKTAAAVRKAYAEARTHSEKVLVETFVEGRDYRLMVFRGRVIWTVERVPGAVTGDGVSTVRQLVDQLNADPRRSDHPASSLKPLVYDDEAETWLAAQGLDGGSVPAAGQAVRLRGPANVSRGGVMATPDDVHPDNQLLAVRAGRALRIDLAGVDLIIPDIARSWKEAGAGICEVNAGPEFINSAPESVYGEILDGLIDGDGRLPIALVVGAGAGSRAGWLASRMMGGAGVGLATAEGAWLGADSLLRAGPVDVFTGARLLLGDEAVETAIIALDDMAFWRTGAPFDRCAVAAFAGSALAGEDGPGFETLARALLPMTTGKVVVNAHDAGCLALIPHVSGADVILYADRPGLAAVAQHQAKGGAAVWVEETAEGPRISVAGGEKPLLTVPIGRLEAAAADVALAAALTVALGRGPDAFRASLAPAQATAPFSAEAGA